MDTSLHNFEARGETRSASEETVQAGLSAALAGRWHEALRSLRKSPALRAASAAELNNLGVAYLGCRRNARAAACFRRAWRKDGRNPQYAAHLARAYWAAGAFALAVEAWNRALELEPGNAGWRRMLAAAELRLGLVANAAVHARVLVESDPRNTAGWTLLGECLLKTGHAYEAADAYATAVRLAPENAVAWNNLGGARLAKADVPGAILAFRRAETITKSAAIGSNALLAMHYDDSLTPEQIFTAHRQWGARLPQRRAAAAQSAKTGRLRIGYVSGDLRDHSVAFLIEPVLAAHDPAAVEVFLYSTAVSGDERSDRIRTLGWHWRQVTNLTDEEACGVIRKDGIDVLVDLSGHTTGNRLGIFAACPAPAQVTYCGYPNTTGMLQIGYRITDFWCDPPGMTEHLHTERLIRLEDGFICYLPPEYAPPVAPLPALRNGCVTFGCLAARHKVSDRMLRLWATILRRVRTSRLILKSQGYLEPRAQSRILGLFAEEGVAAERIFLLGRSSRREHIRIHNEIDVVLDTYPYHGTIGTCEALWMGVPVVTLAGRAHVSRVGVSLLARTGLDDWIAATPEAYVDLAISAAADRERLGRTRGGLREQLAQSSVIDPARIARPLEAAYRRVATAEDRRA